MSKEQRHVTVAFTVHSPDNLPLRDGQQMYADDVEVEVRDAVQAAVTEWYQSRGNELVTYDPLVG
ncbi:hypothetical protein [Streptomyces pseudovenezuelae]|uniref:hypothetical protein n=1 Tax=Streptomyces pseudovenezuelae TaxID=67350 RepID=UPI002E3187B9|nr:hypothetical protein [Streptomyces pseudovenezuelae]